MSEPKRVCEDCGAWEPNLAFIICWVCAGNLTYEPFVKKPPKKTMWQTIKEWFTS